MYKVGVIGEKNSILGFSAVGLDIRPVIQVREAVRELHRMAEAGYAVIFITEFVAEEIAEEVDAYRSFALPAIIPIPGSMEKTGIGIKGVKAAVERAVGVDFLFKERLPD